MRITILAIGSRGDVQPLIALGGGLKARGFEVRLATHADFEALVRESGLHFHQLPGRAAGFFSGPAGVALRERARRPDELARFVDNYLGTYFDQLLNSCWDACDSTAAVLWSWSRCGPTFAEKLRVPVFIAGVNPVMHLPTSAFANPFVDGDLRAGRRSWSRAIPFARIAQRQVDRFRQKLGLGAQTWREELRAVRRMPHLFGFSAHVLPRPRDWREHVHVTGFWFGGGGSDTRRSPELEAFVDRDAPAVAIGFSSQAGRDAARLSQIIGRALELANCRGVIVSGFGGVKPVGSSDRVLAVDTVPYDWLLPRVSAMVHHGGAGSTAAAIRAGIPSMAVPFGYDQRLWGEQIAAIGVGTAPIAASAVTPESLADAIRRLTTDDAVRTRAREIAEKVRAEDGVATAVGIIERSVA
jgi:UDP:flavonoid glycosyltransferase YjiC (YdhE family)